MKKRIIELSMIAALSMMAAGCGEGQTSANEVASAPVHKKTEFVKKTDPVVKEQTQIKKMQAKLLKQTEELSKKMAEVEKKLSEDAKVFKEKASKKLIETKKQVEKTVKKIKQANRSNEMVPMTKDEIEKMTSENKLFKGGNVLVKKGYKSGDFYVLKLAGRTRNGYRDFIAFIDIDSGRTFIGGGFEKDGTPITVPANKKLVDEGVGFTYGEGEKEIYVVTDPQCPYCRMMEEQLGEKLKKDYKVHVILYPLSFHKDAPKMTKYILSGADASEKRERMEEVMVKHSDKWRDFNESNVSSSITDLIKKGSEAASELGARGTPAVYSKDLKEINRGDL